MERRVAQDAGTVDGSQIMLMDNWLGIVMSRYGDEDLRTGNNADHYAYDLGTKVSLFCGGARVATFVYLQVGVQHSAIPIGAKSLVVNSPAGPFLVTNDAAVQSSTFIAAAVAIGPVADRHFGWFWCGGFCPGDSVRSLAGEYVTAGPVVPGWLVALGLPTGIVALGRGHTDERGGVGVMFGGEPS